MASQVYEINELLEQVQTCLRALSHAAQLLQAARRRRDQMYANNDNPVTIKTEITDMQGNAGSLVDQVVTDLGLLNWQHKVRIKASMFDEVKSFIVKSTGYHATANMKNGTPSPRPVFSRFAASDVLEVKNSATASNNGFYTVSSVGSESMNFSPAPLADGSSEEDIEFVLQHR